MSEQARYFPIKDGLPTTPDVAVIQRAFPDLHVGDRIEYSEIERITGIAYGSSRWASVTNRWRNVERARGYIILCDPKVAFFVATADQISSRTFDTLKHIRRSARKQRESLSTVESHSDVTDDTRMKCQHQGRLMWHMEKEAQTSQKNILPDLRSGPPVRIAPPQSGNAEAKTSA